MEKFVVLVTALLLTVSLFSCDSSEEETVKFGVIGPLSGENALYGTSVEDGAMLALEEINADGGVLGMDLEIIAYDSLGDSTEGVQAYNRLIEQDEIDALIGPTFSGVSLAVKDLAVADGIPMLSPTATNATVTLDADNVFRACYTDSYQGSAAAVFADEYLEAENVAILFNRDDAYSEGLSNTFMAEYDSRSLSYTAYEFGDDDDDFSALLTNIKAGNFDLVFLPSYVTEVGQILTQASTINLDVPFLGGDGWDGVENSYAAVAEGSYFANHYAKTEDTEVVQSFVSAFTEKYGEAPNTFSALAYDAVYAMVEAFEAAGATDSASVVSALHSLNYTDAVTGTIVFDDQGDPIKPITVIKIEDGELVAVTKVEIED